MGFKKALSGEVASFGKYYSIFWQCRDIGHMIPHIQRELEQHSEILFLFGEEAIALWI